MTNTRRISSLFLALVLASLSIISAISSQNHEILDLLKRLNKPAIKSIKSSDGDIIDCVKIEDQPAFDHPLLKNHTIELSPTFVPEWVHDKQTDEEPISQLWQLSGSCPDGTIPIRRTYESDIIRQLSFANKNLSINAYPVSQVGNEAALGYVNRGKYFGTKANINIWNPYVDRKDEYSKSQIWVIGAKNNKVINSLEAGLHVSPMIYGNKDTRFFIFWTNNRYRTGCYNLLRSGFIQVSKRILLGGTVRPYSIYGQPSKMINLSIWKDGRTGSWVLASVDEIIGYWPKSLFPYMQKGATMVQWGGVVQNNNYLFKHTTTQMGSGHFAEEDYGKAGNINNILVLDQNYIQQNPVISTKVTRPECYDVKIRPYDSAGFRTHFYYGGPGKNPKCP
ncbi:hypothetical protein ACFE04_004507 [Oxalis oulophora]